MEDSEFLVRPDPDDDRLFRVVDGVDQDGRRIEAPIINERPLTLYLNGRRIVTAVTIGDYPEYLAVGYLMNQAMLRPEDTLVSVEHDPEARAVRVVIDADRDLDAMMSKRTHTSGCALGTVYGDILERFADVPLDTQARFHTRWLYALSKKINTAPSLYLTTGAIHGCVLCEEDRPLVFMEDVGRHNAVDKIAGYMRLHGISPRGKSFYTTGRLTSEMVMKCVQMEIPVLVSRSGFTAWGVELAREAGLTLIGRAKGKRFLVLAGEDRLVWDADPAAADEEPARARRKGSRSDD
ncbi:formate dehydrogenase accessory sulfurtransferase FdhD [Caenispirillum bisanense]|uniref:Sulfur carrier protein FdhD n=1 Tax=Caenispirillum bisanense TaxID=414052 RepID=A0A286G5X5_9PROT|nr:formate dehydrogenase accessory sulfurtransferase FdhD [Caenispirillum bisanense]SOD90908.1 FdhD protein [Caenispirillum bisanense]